MEIKTNGGNEMTAPNCTCGKCLASTIDNHGNIDYGFEWNTERETYTPRDCPEAAARRVANAKS